MPTNPTISITTDAVIKDLVERLRSLARAEHDDLSVADEAAALIETLWEPTMAYEFFVLMQRRRDGKQYADLHKTTERIYCTKAEANEALSAMGDLSEHFAVVSMVAMLTTDWVVLAHGADDEP